MIYFLKMQLSFVESFDNFAMTMIIPLDEQRNTYFYAQLTQKYFNSI